MFVLILAFGTWWLGQWQFDRLADRKASNQIVRANEHAEPAPVEDVLAPGKKVAEDDEWRRVSATGTYAVDDTIIWRYRTPDKAKGVDIVVPLVLEDGTAVLVDRGWLQTESQDEFDDLPAPPSGEVTITGWVRADGTGDSGKQPADRRLKQRQHLHLRREIEARRSPAHLATPDIGPEAPADRQAGQEVAEPRCASSTIAH